jgi:hypothetical protein
MFGRKKQSPLTDFMLGQLLGIGTRIESIEDRITALEDSITRLEHNIRIIASRTEGLRNEEMDRLIRRYY